MSEHVKLIYDGKTYELPLIKGSEGEKAIDISALRQTTGLITLDPGFANTGSCVSTITFMDGEKGILRYRGIPVEQLAEYSIFTETTYLLINGVLPTSTVFPTAFCSAKRNSFTLSPITATRRRS